MTRRNTKLTKYTNLEHLTPEQKEKMKEQAIVGLFYSEELKAKLDGILHRNRVGKDTQLNEDALQVVMEQLWKKSPDYICDAYLTGKLLGLAVRIACWKVAGSDNGLPSHSLLSSVLHTSNLGQSIHLSNTEAYEDVNTIYPLLDKDTEDNWFGEEEPTSLLNQLEKHLGGEDLEFFLSVKRPKQLKISERTRYQNLLEQIRATIITQDIKINMRMTQEQIFNNITQLKPVLDSYLEKGTAHFPADLQLLLRETYTNVIPGVRPDTSCSSCVISAIAILQSYYEREYPKWLEQQPQNDQEAPKEAIPAPATKEATKDPASAVKPKKATRKNK
ncbi:MAG: hypothetical protein EOO97_00095 [Pedobacter sp.]|nr:MAG: hypothetical protein EOO97_00095 [Pedobacter sp.]